MKSRKTQFAWTLVGIGLGLAATVLTIKLTEGSTSAEQDVPPPAMPAPYIPLEEPLPPPTEETPPSLPVPASPMGKVLPPIAAKAPTQTPLPPEPVKSDPPSSPQVSDLPPLPRAEVQPPKVQQAPLPMTLVPPESTEVEPKSIEPNPLPSLSEDSPKPEPKPSVPQPDVELPSVSTPPPMSNVVKPVILLEEAPVAQVEPPYSTYTPDDVTEPPLAPLSGPVQRYHVHRRAETLRDIAQKTLNDVQRWNDVYKLNARYKPDAELRVGTIVQLPADACIPTEVVEAVKPLPSLRPDKEEPKEKIVYPLTGTFPCTIDTDRTLTMPRSVREQFGFCDTVLISPGPDHCLWLTNQDHLERLSQRLEKSDAREVDVRIFKRLYYAQTAKTPVNADGRIVIPERLSKFAGLYQEVVLVGIDDHIEIWDVGRWREYTQRKSVEARHAFKVNK